MRNWFGRGTNVCGVYIVSCNGKSIKQTDMFEEWDVYFVVRCKAGWCTFCMK